MQSQCKGFVSSTQTSHPHIKQSLDDVERQLKTIYLSVAGCPCTIILYSWQ
jgi:hypothetical protein